MKKSTARARYANPTAVDWPESVGRRSGDVRDSEARPAPTEHRTDYDREDAYPRPIGGEMANPVPDGYHTVTPYLVYDNPAADAIEWYKKAFGAKERMRMDAPGGMIGHAEIEIGDGL